MIIDINKLKESHKKSILKIIDGRYEITNAALSKLTNFSLNNPIMYIFNTTDFDKFLTNYENENIYRHGSLTGDFFVDNPMYGTKEIDGYICISI